MFGSTTFWTFVATVIFVFVAFKPARKAFTGTLDQRADKIRNELEEAQKLREEAQAALAAAQRRQRQPGPPRQQDAARRVDADLVAELSLALDEAVRRERILGRVLRIISQQGHDRDAVIDAVLAQADAKGRPLKSMPHSGFERLLAYMTGMENIRDVIPFPRTPQHIAF